MRLNDDMTRRALDAIRDWEDHKWTVQGFGMIRTYLDDKQEWRLNVWDDRLRYVAEVSDIHDHPWDFRSWVVAGEIDNVRYRELEYEEHGGEPTHNMVLLKTGEHGGALPGVVPGCLANRPITRYFVGESYAQPRTEIHRTIASRGCVTVNRRSEPTPEYTARVFFPLGTEWVAAKPRVATLAETSQAIKAAVAALHEARR